MGKFRTNKIKQLTIIPVIFILFTGLTPAFAGPVVIGGDDLTDHGFNTGSLIGATGACDGDNKEGWLYIENAVANLLRDETRAGNHTVDILAIGSGIGDDCDGDAGSAIASAAFAISNSTVVRHCNGSAAIDQCFADLASGAVNPKMLHIAGTGASNDISGSEGVTITSHASEISAFVTSGGGLLAHGSGSSAFGWLSTLLPGFEFGGSCSNSGAVLTPEGAAAFPLITNEDIRSGPCHDSFSGNFGGLGVIAFDTNGKPFIVGIAGGVGGSIEKGTGGNGGDNQWDTRPTFGISHETRQDQIVENGFTFNTEQFTLTDNHWTDFAEQSIEIGTINTFSATVWADKGLKIQEFLFGIPNVGESHLAELGIEIWYDNSGEIQDVIVVQNSHVIDADTISVSHEMTKCLSTDEEARCDTTTVSVTFLEPLQDKVMAIKAIDWKNRDQRTYLNDGFDISGESLNPMLAKMIPSTVKYEGLLKITQEAKYSTFWTTEDGRIFEMNNYGSFKQINQSFERFQDTGTAYTRMHSGFGGIIAYEQNRALDIFDSSKLVAELPASFAYIYPETGQRISDEIREAMLLQEQIAKGILDEMDKQSRNY